MNLTNTTGSLTVDTVTAIADHASRMSDRWLFVAMLAIMLLSMLALAKLVLADRSKLTTRLENVTEQYIGRLKEESATLSSAIANNTAALNKFADAVDDLKSNCTAIRRA